MDSKYISMIPSLATAIVSRDIDAFEELADPLVFERLCMLRRAGKVLNADTMQKMLELLYFDKANEISSDIFLEFMDAGRITAPVEEGKSHVIHLAAKYGLSTLVETLVSWNPALMYVKDALKETAIFWAAAMGQGVVVDFFKATLERSKPVIPARNHCGFFSSRYSYYSSALIMTVLAAVAAVPIPMSDTSYISNN